MVNSWYFSREELSSSALPARSGKETAGSVEIRGRARQEQHSSRIRNVNSGNRILNILDVSRTKLLQQTVGINLIIGLSSLFSHSLNNLFMSEIYVK